MDTKHKKDYPFLNISAFKKVLHFSEVLINKNSKAILAHCNYYIDNLIYNMPEFKHNGYVGVLSWDSENKMFVGCLRNKKSVTFSGVNLVDAEVDFIRAVNSISK